MGNKQLTRKLGLAAALAVCVGEVVGSGIFVNTGKVARASGSAKLTIIAWLLGGLFVIPQMMITAELATAYPEDGYGYIYFKKAGSSALAFLFGWSFFLALDPPGITVLAVAVIPYIAKFIPFFNNGLAGKFLSVALILLFTIPHYRSVKQGALFNTIITVAKILPFVILIGLGFVYMKVGNLGAVATTAQLGGASTGLWAGISATTWAYAGMGSVCYMSGEFKDPQKTLPKALIGSAVIVTLLYTLVSVTVLGNLPFGEVLASKTPLCDSLKYIPGLSTIGSNFVSIAAIIVILGSLSASIMFQPRMQYAMAKDKLFFNVFSHVSPKYETPDWSILIQVAYSIILVFFTTLSTLLGYFTIVYLIANIGIFMTILWCRKKPDYHPTYKCPAMYLMLALAVFTCLGMAWGTIKWAPVSSLVSALVVLATGLPMYYYWNSKNKKAAEDVAVGNK